MLNIVTAFQSKVPHMGQLIHEAIHVIDDIKSKSPVGNTILPLNHAVFRQISDEDVMVMVGNNSKPILRLVFRFNPIFLLWELSTALDMYLDEYAEEILRARNDPQTN